MSNLALFFDECRYRHMAIRPGVLAEVSDAMVREMREVIRDRFGFDPGKDNMREALERMAELNSFHPFLDWLGEIPPWDGIERNETWFITYLGAPDTPYIRALSKIMMTAAVRRVKQPGCEFQLCIIFEGVIQGQGKSKALKTLVGLDYFSDQDILLHNANPKKQMEFMEGVVIYELADLNLKEGNIDSTKAFVSRQEDQDRMAFGHFKAYRKRRCIFVATVNEIRYLLDRTGNRRFAPVKTTKIDLAGLARDREQLWAEALVREAAGESIELPEALWGIAAQEQDERLVTDPWEDLLADIAVKAASAFNPGEGNVREPVLHRFEGQLRIRSRDIMTHGLLLGIPVKDQTQSGSKRLATAMRRMGWSGPVNMAFETNGKVDKGYWIADGGATRDSKDSEPPF
jgi:predicted P-loop ATPase